MPEALAAVGASGAFLAAPTAYGPYTTIHNRFNRRSRQGLWSEILFVLTGATAGLATWALENRAARRSCGPQVHALFVVVRPP